MSLFLLLAKMLSKLWVLVGSAIHNVHNTIKGCNTGTSWISADRDSKLGKFCVCSTVCMHADGFANFNFRGLNFRTIFIFREIHENQTPAKKKGFTVAITIYNEHYREEDSRYGRDLSLL